MKFACVSKRLNNLLTFAILVLSFGAAVVVRIQNVERLEGKYFLGTDAYRFFRQADYIVEHGRLPERDMMRWFPDGRDLTTQLSFSSYVIAYLYRLLHFFNPSLTLYQTALYYPIICYVFSLLVLFLLVSRLIGKNVALLSIGLLSVSPAVLSRSTAGFADRDSLSLLLGLCSFYCYFRSFQTNNREIQFTWSALSGFIMMLLGLTWEGVGVFTSIIVLVNLIHLVLGQYRKEDLVAYLYWLTPIVLGLVFFTRTYRVAIYSPFVIPALIVPILFLLVSCFYFALIRLRKIASGVTLDGRLPVGLCVVVLSAVIVGGGLLFAAIKSGGIRRELSSIVDNFLSPLGRSRLMESVGELQDPSSIFWHKNYSLLFLSFSVGILLSLYKLASALKLNPWLIIASFEFLLINIFFAKLPHGTPQHFVSIPNFLLFFALLQFWFTAIELYIYSYWKNTSSNIKLEAGWLFLIVWFTLTSLPARGAMRYNFFFAPVAVTYASYAFVRCFQWLGKWVKPFIKKMSSRERKVRISGWILVLLTFFVSVSSLVTMIGNSAIKSYNLGKAIGPLISRQQEVAFKWIDENLSDEAVIAAWWDYGSEINVLAQRATIIDEDHYIPDRIYLMARHVFVAKDEKEAVQFLKSYGATHFMMCGEELKKLEGISILGSDENFDRQFSLVPLIETNFMSKDKGLKIRSFKALEYSRNPLQYMGETYSPKQWSIQDVQVQLKEEYGKFRLERATIFAEINDKVFKLPPKHIYFAGREIITEDDALPGGLAVFSLDKTKHNPFDKRWRSIYIPKKGLESIAVQLYLLEVKTLCFELVYNDVTENSLRRVKIWKINYPNDIKEANNE